MNFAFHSMSDQPIFRVANHHTAACGRPPAVDDSEPNRYLGYFENEHGEQAIFVYDRARRAGTFRCSHGSSFDRMATQARVCGRFAARSALEPV